MLKLHTPQKIMLIIIVFLVTCNGACFALLSRPTTIPATPDPPTREQIAEANNTDYFFDYTWAKQSPYIAHALGGILGNTYTNSHEAFLLNYSLGQRVFEIDIDTTDDGQLVLLHKQNDWRSRANIDGVSVNIRDFTYNNFKSSLMDGKYHTLSLDDMLELMAEYPDVYIITDTKATDPQVVNAQFSNLVEKVQSIDGSLLQRIIPQIYNEAMLDELMAVHNWGSIIYTLYADPDWTDQTVADFMKRTGVNFITLWGEWCTKERIAFWQEQNPEIIVAAHTINDLDVANNLREIGVDLIYTDFLTP